MGFLCFKRKMANTRTIIIQGENVQLQMELARLDKVKSNLTSELTKLSAEAEKFEELTTLVQK